MLTRIPHERLFALTAVPLTVTLPHGGERGSAMRPLPGTGYLLGVVWERPGGEGVELP